MRNDVWLLHVGGAGPVRWEEAAVAGDRPRPRHGHGAALLPTASGEVLLVFGGRLNHPSNQNSDTPDADYSQSFLHALRLKPQLRWEAVAGRGACPRALAMSASCLLGSKLAVFGGLELRRQPDGRERWDCAFTL